MKRIFELSILCGSLAALWGVAQADYRPSQKQESASQDSSDRFNDAVDLSRFRKGNYEWDTQALIVSGLKALHEDQVLILNKLDQMQSRLERLERGSGSSSERGNGS